MFIRSDSTCGLARQRSVRMTLYHTCPKGLLTTSHCGKVFGQGVPIDVSVEAVGSTSCLLSILLLCRSCLPAIILLSIVHMPSQCDCSQQVSSPSNTVCLMSACKSSHCFYRSFPGFMERGGHYRLQTVLLMRYLIPPSDGVQIILLASLSSQPGSYW